ncbi:EXOC6 [Mytilus edulis]|uniref:EXOC6 n=1 Tax=Mytilus edulis TaxID=6550 RepID=A0A8S3RU31_MYTED|nr:EXOC6 [Mytilus edulis]
MFCLIFKGVGRGVLSEKFKGCDKGNQQMLYGSIIHFVFQQVLQKGLTLEEQILKEATNIVQQARFLHDMYKSNTTEGEVLEEIKKYIPQMKKWLDQYTNFAFACSQKKEDLNITKVTDIEENIWCPRYGVKGKIDLTIKNKERYEKCIVPLELKTGRPSFSMEHKGQLIQISINMNYLEKSCLYLEEYISSITGAQNDSVHMARLHGTTMFKDAKSDAEEHIYKQLNLKIDEFMDLASYDWLLPEAKGHASGYVIDLVAFLQSTFMSFTNLPEKVAKTACMSACKHIANSLKEFLLTNEIRQLTMGSLQQFNLDLIQCEQFAASEPIPGANDGNLTLAFAGIRQLLDLFLNWDWSLYLADYGQTNSKYVRVQPQVALSLLEKLHNADKKKNTIFGSLNKKERDKKKLLDTVLKQLRGLVNGSTQQIQG